MAEAAERRLAALAGTLTPTLLSDEALVGTAVRVYMDTWLASQRDDTPAPVRAGRRMRYIDEALKPISDRLGESGRKRLRCAPASSEGS